MAVQSPALPRVDIEPVARPVTAGRRRRPRVRRPPVWMTASALVVGLISILPVAYVLWQAAAVGADEALRLLLRPRVGLLLANTAALTATTTAACALLGLAAAWGVERTDLPGRAVWSVVAALPIAIPAFIASYGWVSLTSAVEGLGGATLILSFAYYPLVYLPVAAMLRGMDPCLEEAARSLGHGPWRVFFRVTLPQIGPALLGGCLLVALHVLGEFGSFALLRFPTFTTAIFDQYRLTYNGAAAAMLALVLVLLCLLLLLLETRVRGAARQARVGVGAARRSRRHRLRRAAPLALGGFALLAALSLGVPLATLSYWLARSRDAAFPVAELLAATWATLRLGLGAAALTTLAALPVAWLAVRRPGRLETLVERGVYVATALPGLIVALALAGVAVRAVRPLYQTTALLLVAYAVLFLPLALVAARGALAQASPSLEEAARGLGCRPAAVVWRVTAPLIAPGLGAAMALVFLSVVTELTATLLLAPIGTNTLAMQVWTNTSSLSHGAAAPYAAAMVAISIVPTYFLMRRSGALAGVGDALA
jgi:iron(III) transport system permease protein